MVYILDTNILSDVLRFGLDTPQGRRVDAVPRKELAITIVTYEEMLWGRISALMKDPKKVKDLMPLSTRYDLLHQTFFELGRYYPPLPFDIHAQEVYKHIPAHVRKKAAHDCRIASIQVALGKGFTVVSRDQKDFDMIEGVLDVQWENWSVVTPP